MKSNTAYFPALLAIGLWLGDPSTSSAQHRHGVPTHRPRIHINLFTPLGRPVTQHHDHYRYVVPPTARHGAFYSYENTYYYTAPVPRGAGPLDVAPRPVQMVFGGSKHYPQLAERLEMLANDFCLDLHHNYRENPNYNEVYGEAYQFLKATKFIHDKEHQGDREAIRRSATEIDNLFHHVQEEVSTLKRHEHRPIGQLSLQAKTEELQAMIHHLLYDLGVKPEHDQEGQEQAPAPAAGREEAPPPPERAVPRRQ